MFNMTTWGQCRLTIHPETLLFSAFIFPIAITILILQCKVNDVFQYIIILSVNKNKMNVFEVSILLYALLFLILLSLCFNEKI